MFKYFDTNLILYYIPKTMYYLTTNLIYICYPNAMLKLYYHSK